LGPPDCLGPLGADIKLPAAFFTKSLSTNLLIVAVVGIDVIARVVIA
jgi:hypothetical protein